MGGQAGNDVPKKIIEMASTRPLGWILEAHCEIQLTDTALEVVFHGKNRVARELLYEEETLLTLQPIVRTVMGREMAVRIVDTPSESNVDVHNQLAEPSSDANVISWKGFRFRSHAEVRIAEALDRKEGTVLSKL